MRIVPFSLPLVRPFHTAHGVLRHRPGFAVQMATTAGVIGCGEGSPLTAFGTESESSCARALQVLAKALIGRVIDDDGLDACLDLCEALAPEAPTARAAMDMALHDLLARRHGVSVAALLAQRAVGADCSLTDSRCHVRARRVTVNAVIGGADSEALARAVEEALAGGFGVLKLKLGTRALKDDLAQLATIVAQCPQGARLRLDVNGRWSEEQALYALDVLRPWPIESLEQPLPANDLAAMARVRAQAGCVVALDEAIADAAALERAIALGAADRVVLKPAAVGGLRSAWRMAERARLAGLGVAVTSFIDSSIGVHAAWQFAAALPGELPPCGLATGMLLAHDLALPPALCGDQLGAVPEPGIGRVFDARCLQRARCGVEQEYH